MSEELSFTRQETFDLVAGHLLTQATRSYLMSDGITSCAYRSSNTGGECKCAAGCLIPDRDYDPAMEGLDVYGVSQLYGWKNWFGHSLELVRRLQVIHDAVIVPEWSLTLRELAESRDLNVSVVDELEPQFTERIS